MLDEKKTRRRREKSGARKKPRNGKIENADIRENAEVSHAWGTNVGSRGPPSGTDLVVWNLAFPEHSDLLGMSPESVASSGEFTFPDASDRLGMASEGVVGPEVSVLPVACDRDSEGWAG